MKNLKSFLLFCILFALPFFSKAQFIPGGSTLPNLTINYVDYGYGPLSCKATTTFNNPEFTQTISPSGSYTYYGYSSMSTGLSWQYLSISAGGIIENGISIANLESQTIGVNYGYHYVSATRGTAPVYTIKRNSPYNYTITAWLITM